MTNEELIISYQDEPDQLHKLDILEDILKQNKGLIYSLAIKHSHTRTFEDKASIDIDDLIQEGSMGMMIACDKWDRNNKAAFSTYSVYWINQKMYRFMHPKLSNEGHTETSLQRVVYTSKDGDGVTREDLLENDYTYNKNPFDAVDDVMYYKQIRQQADELMHKRLSLKEQEVLKLYVGWNTEPCSCREIADMMGLKRAWIHNVKNNACKKLRRTMWANDLKLQLFHERIIKEALDRYTDNNWDEYIADLNERIEQYKELMKKQNVV